MAMTFDATLKDMGRDSPLGFLAVFDQPPTLPVKLLKKNDFNLNISRYVSTAKQEAEIDLAATHRKLVEIEEAISNVHLQSQSISQRTRPIFITLVRS